MEPSDFVKKENLIETKLFNESDEDLSEAGEILAKGGLIAFPTETVYGLGADALNEEAVSKVYAAKGRPSDNPMIVHIAEKEEILKLTPEITADMQRLMDAFWPGPMTMIVKRLPVVPDTTTGGLDTVGVRLPSNETARILIKKAGCPVAAPSANISGRPSPTSYEHVRHDLFGRIHGIIMGGDADFGIESSVIDMTGETPTILRPGVITKEMFSDALGRPVLMDESLSRRPKVILDPAKVVDGSQAPSDSDFRPKSPGMKYKHYAPEAEMIIFEGDDQKVLSAMEEEQKSLAAQGKRTKIVAFSSDEEGELMAAHELFAILRQADIEGTDVILAKALPEEGVGFSVMNRMLKSAGYNIRRIK